MFFISDLFNLFINFKFIYSKNEKNKKNVCLIFFNSRFHFFILEIWKNVVFFEKQKINIMFFYDFHFTKSR